VRPVIDEYIDDMKKKGFPAEEYVEFLISLIEKFSR